MEECIEPKVPVGLLKGWPEKPSEMNVNLWLWEGWES